MPASALAKFPTRNPLGALPRFLSNPLQLFKEAANMPAPLVRIRVAHQHLVLVNDIGLVLEMLRDTDRFGKGIPRVISKWVGSGLVFSEGEAWTTQRRIMNPAFHHKAIQSYEQVIQQETEAKLNEFAQAGTKSEAVDLNRHFNELAHLILRDALFGTRVKEKELDILLNGIDFLLTYSSSRNLNPLAPPAWVPTPRNRKAIHTLKAVHDAVYTQIAHRRNHADDQVTFMDMLLHGVDSVNGKSLDTENIIDQVKIFFVAGTETSANTLAATLHTLGQHPEVLKRLQQEVDTVLQGQPITMAHLGHMPYLKAVTQEMLRLHPPGWLLTRSPLEPLTLGGVPFTPGDRFLFSPYFQQRDPKVWPQANDFVPERWLGMERPPANYIPFLRGPRKCIGEQFAIAEVKMILGALIQRLEWEAVPGHEVQLKAGGVLAFAPGPKVYFRERKALTQARQSQKALNNG